MIFIGVIIGLITGLFNFVFGSVLNYIVSINTTLIPYNLFLLPFVGLLIVYLYQRFGKDSNRGFKLVFDAMENEDEYVPKHHGPLMILTTWMGHLFGASVGREGVAVQMGATVADNLSRNSHFNLDQNMRKKAIAAGMAGGFASLFGTPLAGIFFAKEMSKAKWTDLCFWLITISAAFTGNFVTTKLGLSHFHFEVTETISSFDLLLVLKLVFIGIMMSLLGHLFTITLKQLKHLMIKYFSNPYIRIFTMSILFAILIYVIGEGRYISLGTNLINASFNDPSSILTYDFIAKLLFTTFCLSIGFQGGEVTPLFSIGASFGVVIAGLLSLPVTIIAACTYALMFGAATNAYLAAFFIGLEIFGMNIFLPLLIMTVTTYLFRTQSSIYPISIYIRK